MVSRSLRLDPGLSTPVLEFPDTNAIGEEALDVAVDLSSSPVARYVSSPLVHDLISTLYAADDRVTSYATQFLKAIFVSREDMSFRLKFSETLRECTKVRGLRARVFEYTRTNLGVENCREPSTATVGVSRDHLNSILDLLLFCISVPLETYAFVENEITRQQAFVFLVISFCNTITDCLQTVGSGLGMNAGTADGIYSQNHLVERILRCINVLMNTACMHDNVYALRASNSSSDRGDPLRKKVLLTLLRRMLYSWPHPYYGTCNNESGGTSIRSCTVHPLQLRSNKTVTNHMVDAYQSERFEGSIAAGSDSYLAVRVNSPNAVREEAYLSACFELLCCHACLEAYELHHYLPMGCDDSPSAELFSHANVESADGLLDTTVNRILSKIVQGIESTHFKLSLRCIACFQDRGLFLLRRYFISQADIEGGPPFSGVGTICTVCKTCSTCELQGQRREARLDQLVSALRSARGGHWNSRVRTTAGELLDQLLDMI